MAVALDSKFQYQIPNKGINLPILSWGIPLALMDFRNDIKSWDVKVLHP